MKPRSGRIWIKCRGAHRARRLARRIQRYIRHPFSTPALVLMYHRVVALASDPQLLGVSPGNFAEQLEVLRKTARPIPLAHMVESLRKGQPAQRSVVLTLDDGYADNHVNARPLLERYEVPATVFVTAGHLSSDRELWWDELD